MQSKLVQENLYENNNDISTFWHTCRQVHGRGIPALRGDGDGPLWISSVVFRLVPPTNILCFTKDGKNIRIRADQQRQVWGRCRSRWWVTKYGGGGRRAACRGGKEPRRAPCPVTPVSSPTCLIQCTCLALRLPEGVSVHYSPVLL